MVLLDLAKLPNRSAAKTQEPPLSPLSASACKDLVEGQPARPSGVAETWQVFGAHSEGGRCQLQRAAGVH